MPTPACPSTRSPLLAAVPLVLVLLLAACGGSTTSTTQTAPTTAGAPAPTDDAGSPSTTASGSDTPLPCAPAADVSGIVGATVELDPPSDDELGCHYYSEDGAVSVGVTFEDPTTRGIEDVERNLEVDRVEGVGDTAYVSITPGGIVQFGVFAGTRHVLVTVQGVDADATTGQAVYELFA